MVRLRIDTWDAEYGSSFELAEASEDEPRQAQFVEPREWVPVMPDPNDLPVRIGFIDGVRRIDARLFAEAEDAIAPALAGSWAVGVAWSGRPPSIGVVGVGRQLVVGGNLTHPGLDFEIGSHRLTYPLLAVAGSTSIDPILGLQNAMRQAEARLAKDVAEGEAPELLVLDGPLSYFDARVPVVGMIKRQVRPYLASEQAAILPRLGVGQRTPLFILGDRSLERFSWYARIGVRRPIDGVMTGIVRLETTTARGLAAAVHLAEMTAAALPRFATEIGRDPRAPQNLYPVARLESELHHRLGDPALVKRGIEQVLWRGNA